jgi:hypothetical protein
VKKVGFSRTICSAQARLWAKRSCSSEDMGQIR